jgi:hypothetical protein
VVEAALDSIAEQGFTREKASSEMKKNTMDQAKVE